MDPSSHRSVTNIVGDASAPYTLPETTPNAAELFGALSYPHRVLILLILRDGPRTVSSLIEEFPGVTDQFVSRHLGILRRCGLVENKVDGQFRVYALTDLGWRVLPIIDALANS